ncbi:MAG: hypothetical protein QGI25_05885 [Arenicellales bacterium]|jgi:hypothetical protein|nr:hypothetical protein [Arenicellales bacterium]|tara:strand:+ start:89 stop:865 length:777 start_codon:yes stop_codon:yes gene_type:complete
MGEESISGNLLLPSILLTGILVLLHLAAPWFRRTPFLNQAGFTSFSGGFAVAFVFLHMLPGLVESKDSVGAVLHSHFAESHLVDTGVFLLALLGFTIFYGLKRWCREEQGKGEENSRRSFLISIGSFSIYNAVITFTMPERISVDLVTALVFTLAIGLHFAIIDIEHEAHDTKLFNRWGRYVLAGALVVGWGMGVTIGEHSVVAAAFLSSFLAGSVLMNVFHYELSEVSDSRFGAFLTGIASGSALLLIVFFLERSVD